MADEFLHVDYLKGWLAIAKLKPLSLLYFNIVKFFLREGGKKLTFFRKKS